jgi:hypothetical protein
MSCSYSSLWIGFLIIASELYPINREAALRSLFYQTANEVYRLGLPTPDLSLFSKNNFAEIKSKL